MNRLPRHVLLTEDQLRAKFDSEVLAQDINEVDGDEY
jgi:hypothetical protein